MGTVVSAWALVLTLGAVFGWLVGWLVTAIQISRLRRRLAVQDQKMALLMKNQARLPQRIVESAERGAS